MNCDIDDSLKFSFISKISDIIDPVMFDVIIKGLNEEIKQGIVFISDIPINSKNESNNSNQFPDDEYMEDYACSDCIDSMDKGICKNIRETELDNFKSNPTPAKSSYYLCTSDNGLGLHMHFPIFTDNKFIGLLISGTGRFPLSFEKEKAELFISNLNRNDSDYIRNFLVENRIIWHDKDTKSNSKDSSNPGTILNDKILAEKCIIFEEKAKKLSDLLNSIYTGKIRQHNRDLISKIINEIKPVFLRSEYFGKQGYINSFKNIFNFFKDNIFDIGTFLLYDNFIHKKEGNILGQSLSLVISENKRKYLNLSDDIINLLFNNLNKIDDFYPNFFWSPKNEFVKINISNDIKEERKSVHNAFATILGNSFNKNNFLLIMPFNIYNKGKALIILYDNNDIIPFGSTNLKYFFKRIYDIFNFTIHIYYDQILKTNSINMLIHDYRSKGGDIYAKTKYLYDHLYDKNISKLHIKRELLSILNSSESYVGSFNKLKEIGNSDYEMIESYIEENINIVEHILNPLIKQFIHDKSVKNLYINIDDLRYVIVYTNKTNLFRVFENLLSNAIKYSFNNSTIWVSKVVDTDKNRILISVNNLTLKLDEPEFKKIMRENFRGNFAKAVFDKLNKKLHMHKGEGLGLMSVKNIDDIYEWECIFEQLNVSNYKFPIPDLGLFAINSCIVFRATIKNINIKKKGS